MKKIRIYHDEDQKLIGRDVFAVAFFFQRPIQDVAASVRAAFDEWLTLIPKGALEWASIGSNSSQFKAVNKQSAARCRALLDLEKARQRKLTSFTICGGEEAANPGHQFRLFGRSQLKENQTGYFEIRLPSEFVEDIGFDTLVEFVQWAGQRIPYVSAYASPALSRGWENMDHMHAAAKQLMPMALRHPGYDLLENFGACFDVGTRSRGARWLTLLGEPLVEQLGGSDSLSSILDPAIEVLQAGNGVLLRASVEPEIGDVNRAEFPMLLRSVASVIEPVTFFGDYASFGPWFEEDEDIEGIIDRWERRHLD